MYKVLLYSLIVICMCMIISIFECFILFDFSFLELPFVWKINIVIIVLSSYVLQRPTTLKLLFLSCLLANKIKSKLTPPFCPVRPRQLQQPYTKPINQTKTSNNHHLITKLLVPITSQNKTSMGTPNSE